MTKPPPQGVCPVVGLLGHRVVLLFFKEPPYCSGVQPSNSGLFFFFQILFHYRLQGIEYNSMCYIINPCHLSINPKFIIYLSP